MERDMRELEAMVDRHGLNKVLEMLSEVAIAKAEHLTSAWQDRASARAWDKAAGLIERVAARV